MTLVHAWGASWLMWALPALVGTDTPPPEPIIGGWEAEACEWPATVAARRASGGHLCTAALIHPRLVLIAAHCVEGSQGDVADVVFGEQSSAPTQTVPVEGCLIHPGYVNTEEDNGVDLAVCQLAHDAPAVPIVPLLAGCEAEQLSEGVQLALVGYGQNDELNMTGSGTKRWTAHEVQTVSADTNDLVLLSIDGAGICFGDSGGPAYVQLDDGSWRLVGVLSDFHADTLDSTTVCRVGAVYELIHTQLDWLEENAGIDLTPCHDADGAWNPGEACDGFPLSLTDPGAAWSTACQTAELSGPSATCGDPIETGATGSTGTSTSESSTGPETSSTTAADETSSDSSTTAAESESSGGCGCGRGRSWPWWTVLWLPATLGRRGRRGRLRREGRGLRRRR